MLNIFILFFLLNNYNKFVEALKFKKYSGCSLFNYPLKPVFVYQVFCAYFGAGQEPNRKEPILEPEHFK
jgi:hypothetical protein